LPILAAAIDQKACMDFALLAASVAYGRHRLGTVENHVFHRSAECDIHAPFLQHVSKGFVELSARELPCPIPSCRKLLAEIEPANVVAPQETGAVFTLKAFGLDGLHKPGFIEVVHTARDEALADNKPGELLPFDDLYCDAMLV